MDKPLSEMDKQLCDTDRVNLGIGILMIKGYRNACLFLGIVALAVILFLGWSMWLLLLPAALGIGSFLFQICILVCSSELKRHYEEPETPRRHTPEEIEELERKVEFMESHQEMLLKRAVEYRKEHPDESLEDAADIVAERCFLEHELAESEAETARLEELQMALLNREPMAELAGDEGERPLGNLTYDEASVYFSEYCDLMQEEGVSFYREESKLPTTIERMKEALKVECLRWCNHGRDFDESSEFIGKGYIMLAQFLPDESYELLAEWHEFQEKYRDNYDF